MSYFPRFGTVGKQKTNRSVIIDNWVEEKCGKYGVFLEKYLKLTLIISSSITFSLTKVLETFQFLRIAVLLKLWDIEIPSLSYLGQFYCIGVR